MAALFLRSVAVIPRTQNKKFWITFRHLCSHRIMFARTSLVNNEKSKGPAASIPLTLILFHLTAMQEIQWCFEKRAKLSLKVFADHFGYMDKTTANSRYINILQSAVMVEKGAQLMNDFKTWKGSSHELDYWRNKSVEEARKDTAAGLTKTSLRSMKRIGENEEDEVVRKARRMSNDEKPAANVTEEIVTTPPAPLSSTPKQELVGDTWDLHTETEFWCDWMMLIESNQVLHNFDLQRYHVIECGYKIKCRPNIDEDLYNRLGLLKHKTNVNKENRDYIKACFAAKQVNVLVFNVLRILQSN
ncbi:hypothetical protein BJV82DRAFT_184486 [Fennellomyces sp. T-0311]|nr:hypothetical protein BJV82DRAFT_184486 [Fennellomyces sp. T-0311]